MPTEMLCMLQLPTELLMHGWSHIVTILLSPTADSREMP